MTVGTDNEHVDNLHHCECILSLLSVNKYIILHSNPQPIVHTEVCVVNNTTH